MFKSSFSLEVSFSVNDTAAAAATNTKLLQKNTKNHTIYKYNYNRYFLLLQ